MNVAITRAKRSLWVLGASATLRANREWAALIGWVGVALGGVGRGWGGDAVVCWWVGVVSGGLRCVCMLGPQAAEAFPPESCGASWCLRCCKLCCAVLRAVVGAPLCTALPVPPAPCRDAEERGLVIADAEAQDLFPGLSYWQRQQEQQQQQGEGGEGRAAQPQGRREGSAPAPAPAGASAGAGAGLAGLPPLSRVPPSGRASAEVQPLMSPAAAAAMQSLQPQPQPPQPRPMLSLQQQQQQQQQPIPMQRAAEQQLRPAGPTAAPGVRPMQRLHAGQQQQQQQQPGAQARPPAAPSAYPSLPTRR